MNISFQACCTKLVASSHPETPGTSSRIRKGTQIEPPKKHLGMGHLSLSQSNMRSSKKKNNTPKNCHFSSPHIILYSNCSLQLIKIYRYRKPMKTQHLYIIFLGFPHNFPISSLNPHRSPRPAGVALLDRDQRRRLRSITSARRWVDGDFPYRNTISSGVVILNTISNGICSGDLDHYIKWWFVIQKLQWDIVI